MRAPAALAVSVLPIGLLLLAACDVSMYSGAGFSVPAPEPAPAPSPLAGWTIEGHARRAYLAEVDGEVQREGHPTIRFHPTQDTGGAYGTFMTTLDARPFRGRKAHATLWVRTQGVTSRGDVWLRAQASDSPADGPGLATSLARLQVSADFTRYELTVDVPDDAANVQLGVGLGGPGMLWMDGVTVEAR